MCRLARYKCYIVSICMLVGLGILGQGNVYASAPSNWAIKEIEAAKELKAITSKLADGYQETLTRAEFVELLVKSYEAVTGHIMDISTVKNPFKDANEVYLIKAYTSGISRGTSATTFSPEARVTREQMVVMMVRMVEMLEENRLIVIFQKPKEEQIFTDQAEIAGWAVDAVEKAYANGLTSGIGENCFNPKGFSTKEQVIIANYRLLLNIEKSGQVIVPWREKLLSYEQDVAAMLARNFGGHEKGRERGFVTVSILNMRSTPDLTSKANIIRKLAAYEEVIILEEVGAWYKIIATGEEVGYVYRDYIHIYRPDSDLEGTRVQIVAYAKQFIGTPYRYAGSNLTEGVDCSGFTGQILRPFGYVLDRSSRGQGRNGVAISEYELKAGDLIFYGYKKHISHVALYIGEGKIIHATVSGGVKITGMRGFLRKPLISFRRVIF